MLKADPGMQANLQWHTFENFDALSTALSEQWLTLIQQAEIGSSFALAGGSTPSPVYRKLDTLLAQNKAPALCKLVATDERWVTDADAQSNEGLFRRCFEQSMNAGQTSLVSLKDAASTPEVATSAIHQRLQQQLPKAFDAVLIGMGADGHVASLFPGAPVQHDDLDCLAALHPQTRQCRMSLSLPRLVNTRRIWLVISGAEKRQVLENAAGLPVEALVRAAGCTVDVFWCP